MSALLWALVGLPLMAGAALALCGRAADRMAAGVGVAVAFGCVGLAVAAAYAHPAARAPLLAGLPVTLAVDGLSGLMVVTVTAITAAVLLFSVGDMRRGEARARFFGLMLLFSGAMLTTVTAVTLPVLLMAWEMMGATSWALIAFWWRDPERVHAANTAFLTTRAADLGLYLAAGAALAAGQAGALAIEDLSAVNGAWLTVITAGVVVAALGKSAQLPFSFWLSRAMQGPSPVSALLHSATMVVAGAYLLIRLEPLLDASEWAGPLVAWTGAATAVLLGLVATAQTDLKQLLAASSCAQIGFMILAAGAGSLTGGTLQLMAHAAAKSLAVLVAGAWLTAVGSRQLSSLRGTARRYPAAGIAFTVAALTLAGVPPMSLWAAKDVLLAAALEESPVLYAVGLAAAVISAVYAVKALWFVWQPEPEPATGAPLPRSTHPPLIALATACVALTVLAVPPVRDAVGRVIGATAEAASAAWELALSAVLALATSVLVWARGPLSLRTPWSEWLKLEAAARTLVVGPVDRLAHALATFDDQTLDRAVDDSARRALRLARWTNRRAERRIDGVVEGVARVSRLLGRWARRPQTGQLHQYLAQAVAAFTVLAVVIVFVR
ncbi:NADH-quinone oxidoreductase subunit 5 family protein [Streptomyces pristinaespiralis]|uniref:NADH-quinone oxidoreductase subunit 5 family protein n=1 Tax=Streptomyces pristinaespiralis TaxID=38300 RepID=UPI0033F59BE5